MKQIKRIAAIFLLVILSFAFTACAAEDFDDAIYEEYVEYSDDKESESEYIEESIYEEEDVNAIEDSIYEEEDVTAIEDSTYEEEDVNAIEDSTYEDENADAVAEADGEDVSVTEDTYEEAQYYFRNDKLLSQHYEKHGIEMGFSSKEEYEKAASDVITNPNALFKHEAEDGDEVYYVEETNEFAILSTDGYIRTYFYPSAGKAYFDRQ